MANSLPVAEQFALARNFVRTRPTRVILLVLLAVVLERSSAFHVGLALGV